MSARKVRRPKKTTAAAPTSPSPEAIEDARLALLGAYATCSVIHLAFTPMMANVRMVLTRGAIDPIRRALELLGERDSALWGGSPRTPSR